MRSWRNPSTGEVQQIPVGIDPGFDYNPGTEKDLVQGSDARHLLHALDTAGIEAEIEAVKRSAPLGTLSSPQIISERGATQPTTERTLTIADLLRGALRQETAVLDILNNFLQSPLR
jgi:hypothetical protein